MAHGKAYPLYPGNPLILKILVLTFFATKLTQKDIDKNVE